MESLKEYLERRQEEETKNFDKAKTGREQESAFAARYALADVEIKIKEMQRNILEKIIKNIDNLRAAIDRNHRWGMDHYYNKITGILETYPIIFGKEEYEEITNDPGNLADGGIDPEKLKKILEDLK